jgi:hypothetical protein
LETPTDSQLSLADLQSVLALIDLASSKGVFRGADLLHAGTIYTKFAAFIKSAENQQSNNNGRQASE